VVLSPARRGEIDINQARKIMTSTVPELTVSLFSRELRRKTQQGHRTDKGPAHPGAGQPRARGGCCLLLLIIAVAVMAWAFLDQYVLHPVKHPKKETMLTPAVVRIETAQEFLKCGIWNAKWEMGNPEFRKVDLDS
jgi:hypothetical protein